jgi:hypothetical protein
MFEGLSLIFINTGYEVLFNSFRAQLPQPPPRPPKRTKFKDKGRRSRQTLNNTNTAVTQ